MATSICRNSEGYQPLMYPFSPFGEIVLYHGDGLFFFLAGPLPGTNEARLIQRTGAVENLFYYFSRLSAIDF